MLYLDFVIRRSKDVISNVAVAVDHFNRFRPAFALNYKTLRSLRPHRGFYFFCPPSIDQFTTPGPSPSHPLPELRETGLVRTHRRHDCVDTHQRNVGPLPTDHLRDGQGSKAITITMYLVGFLHSPAASAGIVRPMASP